VFVKEYNKKVEKKIDFLYGSFDGNLAEKKKKERKRSLILLMPISCLLFAAFYFLGIDFLESGLIGFSTGLMIALYSEYSIFQKAKKKCRIMRFELSEITERLAILLEAGVPLWNALVIISETADEKKPLEMEIKRTTCSFISDSGYYYEPERCLGTLAERTNDATISTFVSLIVQNSRKGGNELSSMLRLQAVNQRTERRSIAKQLADEASTLMVLPSIIILAAIMVLVAAPAVISFF